MQCRRNYIPTIKVGTSFSMSKEKGGGGEMSFTKNRACVDWWWELNACINRVGIVCPLLVCCVGSRGLGLAALVSGGGWVSQWSADVAVWSFRVERGGGRRCAAVKGSLSLCW
jgi:hypothetical protein